MSHTTWIPRKYAPSLTHLNEPDEDCERDNAIRLYRNSPLTGSLQIRTQIGINRSKSGNTGKVGKYIITADYLSTTDLRVLRDGIDKVIAEIEAKS